jgi:pimeloyl-ACP methyl ester carboxylesterase
VNPTGYGERTYRAQDGLRLVYRDYGDPASRATPVLCLAGLTRNAADFHTLALRLCDRRRVLAPDYRGRGRSDHDPDWRHYTGPTYLGDILALLTLSDIGRVVVIGTSMGGLLGMGLAVVQPTAVAGLVLNDVGPDLGDAGLDRIVSNGARARPLPDWEAAIAYCKQNFANHPERSAADWLESARATFREGEDGMLYFDYDPAIFRALAKDAARPDLWTLYKGLRDIPCLAIRGGKSDVLTASTFERMAVEKPDLVRCEVPGVGHVPPYSQPDVARALHDLLERIDRHSA